MNNRFFGAILINLSIGCLAGPCSASANPKLWSTSSSFELVGNPAAKFTITGGSTSGVAQSTRIIYYTDTGCVDEQSSISTNATTPYTFNNPTTLVQASGVIIWGFNPVETTQSVQVIPKTGAAGAGTDVFKTTPCFPVTCTTASAKCLYTGPSQIVELN